MTTHENTNHTPARTEHKYVHHFRKLKDNVLLMSVLSYLGIFTLIPFFVERKNPNPFVKFHVKQGLVLLVIEAVLWLLYPLLAGRIWIFVKLIELALIILSIIGIKNVFEKQEKKLPYIGDFARYFKF